MNETIKESGAESSKQGIPNFSISYTSSFLWIELSKPQES